VKGVDTNILVRFLVADDKAQTRKVYELFKEVESKSGALFVPLVVVLELIWVLESAYKIPREEIVESIEEMLLMPILRFEHRPAVQQFVHLAPKCRCDLSDLLIGCSAREQGCENVITFDKKASKSELFELLQ